MTHSYRLLLSFHHNHHRKTMLWLEHVLWATVHHWAYRHRLGSTWKDLHCATMLCMPTGLMLVFSVGRGEWLRQALTSVVTNYVKATGSDLSNYKPLQTSVHLRNTGCRSDSHAPLELGNREKMVLTKIIGLWSHVVLQYIITKKNL